MPAAFRHLWNIPSAADLPSRRALPYLNALLKNLQLAYLKPINWRVNGRSRSPIMIWEEPFCLDNTDGTPLKPQP